MGQGTEARPIQEVISHEYSMDLNESIIETFFKETLGLNQT